VVEVERDLSQQQQLLDVVIVPRRRGKFTGTLPDGLGDLAANNLITFKSHREAQNAPVHWFSASPAFRGILCLQPAR
jgi:hypothetical protein